MGRLVSESYYTLCFCILHLQNAFNIAFAQDFVETCLADISGISLTESECQEISQVQYAF